MVYGDRAGLLVYILAYLDMAVGDGIRVFIDTDTVPVAEFSVTDAHFDAQGLAKNIPFFISARDMEARFVPLRNENKDFWYEIHRVSGNPGNLRPAFRCFINIRRRVRPTRTAESRLIKGSSCGCLRKPLSISR